MLFDRKKKNAACVLPDETLKRIRRWRHLAVFPSENPVKVLTDTLATHGRAAYEEATREMLLAMRQRFGTRPGYSILVGVYADPRFGRMLSLAPSPREGQDFIRLDGGVLHPTKEGEEDVSWPEDVAFAHSAALRPTREVTNNAN